MASSLSSKKAVPNNLAADFRALWLVRSRVIRGNLAFLLVIMGYDPRSRSINNRIYLVYALAFFAVWIFMVLTLLADFGAKMLRALPFGNLPVAAALTGTLALTALLLYDLFQATRRSPLVFSEVDARLLCATPLNRRLVTLEKLWETWLTRGAAVWPAAIVLGYALLQAQSPRELTPADLPVYLLAGLRMFVVAVPLYLGTLGFAWAAGAWRLRGQREAANLRWLAPLLAALTAGGLLLGGWSSALIWLAPLAFPIQAGLYQAGLGAGFLVALLLAVLAVAALTWAAIGISLSRAAQETYDREAIQAAAWLGRADAADELLQKGHLGTGRAPTRLPGLPGLAALVWKNLVQAGRRAQLAGIITWLLIVAVLLVGLLFPGWGTRGWALAFGSLLVSRRMIAPLRKELARWWLLRQLPFSSENLVVASLILPILSMLLAGLAALIIAQRLGAPVSPLVIWLYVVTVPGIGLAGAVDILRQSHTGRLLTGSVPDFSLVGVLLALLVPALNGGLAWLTLVNWQVGLPMALPSILLENVLVLILLRNTAGDMIRRIE